MFERSLSLRSMYNLLTPVIIKNVRCGFCKKFSSKSSNDDDSTKNTNLEKDDSVSKLLDDAATFTDKHNTDWATTPYPATAAPSVEDQPAKEKVDPSERSVFLFPGQGIVRVGQVQEYLKFPRVKELFAIANDILGYDLLKICMKGPQKLLDRTEFNQPATVVMSLAALEKLQEERPRAIESCINVAGYSIGELTALIFTGAMPYEEGLKLVGVRATAMQAASDLTPQGMLSCYCSPAAKTSKIVEEAKKWAMDIGAPNPICGVAIYLYTQTKIFGGCNEALEYIQKNSSDLGLRRVQRLPVTGAFHTPLMEPAVKPFIKALNQIPLSEPSAYVYSNYSTKVYNANEKMIKKNLIKQIVSPVKWEQIMHKIYERKEGVPFPRTFDVGSKGTMKAILNKVNAKASASCYIY